ncbi:HipA domain-containing protein [Methylobacterium persicinum]
MRRAPRCNCCSGGGRAGRQSPHKRSCRSRGRQAARRSAPGSHSGRHPRQVGRIPRGRGPLRDGRLRFLGPAGGVAEDRDDAGKGRFVVSGPRRGRCRSSSARHSQASPQQRGKRQIDPGRRSRLRGGREGIRGEGRPPLVHRNGVLVIPRFDRRAGPGGLVRLGQESIVSAIGVSAFGHVEAHETYLEMIRAVSADPMADVVEYLKRELLNQAMGNPDNHGRNTALAKNSSGQVRLTPLFDFAPMRLAPADMGRPTKWACMRPSGRDHAPDWSIVCAAAAGDDLDPDALLRILRETEDRVRSLTSTARRFGVPEAVIDRAIGDRPSRMAETLAAIPKPARTPR